jgi:Putative ATPase subunit of terminase (gpP-like).
MSSCGVAASADGVGHSGLVLYVNGEYWDDSDIGKLMHDFNCTSADNLNFDILAEKTRYLKENPKGVSDMCKVMEDLRDESYAEGHAEWRDEQAQITAKNLYKQGLTIEQIARAIGFSMDTVKTWLTHNAGFDNYRNGQRIVRYASGQLAFLVGRTSEVSELG